MIVEKFRITVKHDNGKCSFIVMTTSGETGAKEQVMKAEVCPERAIIKVKKLS